MPRLVAGLALLLLAPAAAQAACGGSSPDLVAASASRADVLDCVNAAVSGDTIHVPAGTATYSTPITLPGNKDLAVIGATTITCTGTAGSPGYACTAGATHTTLTCTDGCFAVDLGASHRISGFTLTNAGNELVSSVGAQDAAKHFRIDHNRLVTTGGWSPIRFRNNDSATHPQGIWDHNVFEDGISIHTNGTLCQLDEGCGVFQHTLWAEDSPLGDSVSVVYVEANHFLTSVANVNFADGNYGARAVIRFNKTEGPSVAGFEYHSVQGENRGYQRWETYHNALVDLDASDTCFFGMAFLRAGTGVWFNNEMSGAVSGCNESVVIDNVRSADDDPIPGAGLCDGTSPWDQNTPGELGWHCRDQIGTGRDLTPWNHNPPAPWDQELRPAYLWGNTRSGGIVTAAVSPVDRNPLHIQADREYYDHSTATGSPQTTGVRVGILADRPASCTAGVAYWATDEGEWNSLQAGPDGRLHKCVSTNNWSLYYTPYAYPHPWTLDPTVQPTLSVDDVTVAEGDAGTVGAAFTVALSAASAQAVSVSYATADGTATAGSDYQAASGTLSFAPGVVTSAVSVDVLGDTAIETDESFLLELSGPVGATLLDGQGVGTISDEDAPSLSQRELVHGSEVRDDLSGQTGPAGEDAYRLAQAPRSSYEVALDGVSGDVAPAVLERLAADNVTVLQSGTSLRWENASGAWVTNQHVRVRGLGCGSGCGADDVYRVRSWETTYGVARFNNAGSQVTVLVLQNPGTGPMSGRAYFWSGSGALLATQAFGLGGREALVLNTAAVSGLVGQSGSVTVSHDGGHGGLSGKAVALEPATGFTFDTPLVPRPR